MNIVITMKRENWAMLEKIQLSNHSTYRITLNCLGITKGVTKNTSPIVFCFPRCPYSLIFLLQSIFLTPSITFPLGTFLPLDFLHPTMSWCLLDNSCPKSRFSSSPEGFSMVLGWRFRNHILGRICLCGGPFQLSQ